MKRLFLSLMCLTLFVSSELMYCGDYFYVGNQKVNIKVDRKILVLIFKPESYKKNVPVLFDKTDTINEVLIAPDQKITFILFASDQERTIKETLDGIGLSIKDLEWFSYGYIANEVTQLRPTNKISFKLKSGISRKALDSFIDGKALFDQTNFGTPQIRMINPFDDIILLSNKIYESGLVEYCHPDFFANIVPHQDPLYPQQYHLNHIKQIGIGGIIDTDIDAPQAWDITLGSSAIKVAVIDDGLDEHDDLKDGYGISRIIAGYTPYNGGNGSPFANAYHGIPCAGIIAASHNSINVRGIAPNVKLLSINVLNGFTSNDQVADGINWAWQNGADVLSNSWGYQCNSSGFTWPTIINAITNARTYGRGGKGSVVVFSAGNNFPTDRCGYGPAGYISFPSTVSGVICVSSTNKYGNIASYSSRGSRIDVTAMGGENDIRTLDRMGIYGYNSGNDMSNFGGTSAACPQVSGVAALILSINPNFTEHQVRNIITSTATDMGAPGKDDLFGWGRVDAAKAVAVAFAQTYQNYIFAESTASLIQDQTNLWVSFTTSPRPDLAAAHYLCDRYQLSASTNNYSQVPFGWFITSEGFSFDNPNNATG